MPVTLCLRVSSRTLAVAVYDELGIGRAQRRRIGDEFQSV
jgi:hypothetical protein